jgi:uncharacterized protein (TIGR02246 family)
MVIVGARPITPMRPRNYTPESGGCLMSRFLTRCFAIILLATTIQGADDAKSTVAKLNEAWLTAHKAADFDRLAMLYADDAVLMPAFSEPVRGREAIRNFFAEDFKYVPKRSITLKSLRVETSDSVLVDSGDYRYEGVNTEERPVEITGNYITVFKKIDNKWQTAIDIWNARMPEKEKK